MQTSPSRLGLSAAAVLIASLATVAAAASVASGAAADQVTVAPRFSSAVAFDKSKPLRDLVGTGAAIDRGGNPRAGLAPVTDGDTGFTGDDSVQSVAGSAAIPNTSTNFEGLSNQDNFNIFGFRVNPPDPVGDVGPNHYVEMINLVFGVYSRPGTLLLGPVDTGTLWAGFPIDDCTDPSGDPIVVYDQFADRWILTQFTTRGLDRLRRCRSTTASRSRRPATRPARTTATRSSRSRTSTADFFPDYPKYGIWTDSYVITTREFGPTVEYGIGVYALEKNKMIDGNPNARAVSFFLDGNDPVVLHAGRRRPAAGGHRRQASKPQERRRRSRSSGHRTTTAGYGATFDAVQHLGPRREVEGERRRRRSSLKTQLPIGAVRLDLPVRADGPRLPAAAGDREPGAVPRHPLLPAAADLAARVPQLQRATSRWSRTSRSRRRPGVAGVRWYEIRRVERRRTRIYQQGTYAPGDGVHRWMGRIAQDKKGNMALGYSVVNGTDVFPGIRYTGRLAGDPLGQMTLGEGTVINGTGVQTTTNSRWGDYTSMNIDPVDDCTFWYVNEYYTAAGQASSTAGWQTRIASFKLPGC